MLLVSPQSAETAALYSTDKEYRELELLVGATDTDNAGTGTPGKPPAADLAGARQINVTWMVHDISPWRYDRVFPDSDSSAVWIHTISDVPGSGTGVWHRAQRPPELRSLLDKLGLLGKPSAEGGPGILPEDAGADWAGGALGGAAPEDSPSAAATPKTSVRAAAPADGTQWWWALPGAAAGALVALTLRPSVTRLLSRRGRGEPGPRQELLDG